MHVNIIRVWKLNVFLLETRMIVRFFSEEKEYSQKKGHWVAQTGLVLVKGSLCMNRTYDQGERKQNVQSPASSESRLKNCCSHCRLPGSEQRKSWQSGDTCGLISLCKYLCSSFKKVCSAPC